LTLPLGLSVLTQFVHPLFLNSHMVYLKDFLSLAAFLPVYLRAFFQSLPDRSIFSSPNRTSLFPSFLVRAREDRHPPSTAFPAVSSQRFTSQVASLRVSPCLFPSALPPLFPPFLPRARRRRPFPFSCESLSPEGHASFFITFCAVAVPLFCHSLSSLPSGASPLFPSLRTRNSSPYVERALFSIHATRYRCMGCLFLPFLTKSSFPLSFRVLSARSPPQSTSRLDFGFSAFSSLPPVIVEQRAVIPFSRLFFLTFFGPGASFSLSCD